MKIKSSSQLRARRAFLPVIITAALVSGSVLIGASSAQALSTSVPAGTVLHTGDGLDSSSGQFHLRMQSDGNLVLRSDDSDVIWKTGTQGHVSGYTAIQNDGNIVVRDSDGDAVWNSGSPGNTGGSLQLQNDGNLVYRNPSGGVIWASYSHLSVLGPGDHLASGWALWAGGYQFIMQTDGNLVEYDGTKVVWQSKTNGNSGATAQLQTDGNFVIRNTAGNAIYNTGTTNAAGGRLELRSDGVVSIENGGGTSVWQNLTPTTSLKAVAQRLVNYHTAGSLTFGESAYETTYQKEILAVAQNGSPSAGCAVDIRILEVIAMTVQHFGSAKVGDIQRTCVGVSTNCPTSLHCAEPGIAVDFQVLGGTVLTGAGAKDIALLRYLDTIVPSGSQVGQVQCRTAAGNSLTLTNIRQPFEDTCNHDHFDLGGSTGAVKYTA